MARAAITGTGSYLPEKTLTNHDLEKLVETSDEWITKRTGIKERHIVADDEAASDLVVKAARPAMEMAGVTADEIDAVIVATITPDCFFPSTACFVQKELGIPSGVPAFDLSAACTGYLYGLILSNSLIQTGVCKCILLAGSEVLSRFVNWDDRTTCVLFGDGAGASIIQPSPDGERGVLASCWSADGNLGELLIEPAGGSRMPPTEETVREKLHTIHMRGNEVFKHAVRAMTDAGVTCLEKCGLTSDDISIFIPHQANIRIIEATCKRAGIPLDKTVTVIDKIGNVSAATIPVGLDIANREGRIKENDIVLFDAFGGGFTWGATVLRW